jgi:autotransporter-associated beta strand protein
MKCSSRFVSVFAVTAFLVAAFPRISLAGSATWKLNPSNGNWNNSNNWTPATIPNGPSDNASFGQTMLSSISVSAADEVNRLSFLSGASQYTINVLAGTSALTISGVGITNDSGITQNFVIAGGSATYGTISFANSATAGSLTNFTCNGGVTDGGFGGVLVFQGTATAGTADFVANGSTVNGGGNATIAFFDSSSAGGGTFTTYGGHAMNAGGGIIQFAGTPVVPVTANFINRGGEVSGGYPGEVVFYEGNAGDGHFTNVGPVSEVTAYSGATQFFLEASAGHATIDNLGGSVSGGFGGETDFFDTSTAGQSTITLDNGSVFNGQGAIVQFFSESSAGDSNFIVRGSDVTAGFGGTVYFRDNSTAENATFTMKGASVSVGSGGSTFFYGGGKPSAGNAVLINEGGLVSGAPGGQTDFLDPSTASHSTLIAEAGQVSGAEGGAIYFYTGEGDAARIEVFGNGLLDISIHELPGMTVGSIEGDGNIFLGADRLAVGSNDLSTAFSGVIQDGGINGGTGSSLGKIGNGTLTLATAQTYTGGTVVSGGTLVAAHDGALGEGNVEVDTTGAILKLQNGTANDYIANTASLSVAGAATLNLNFTGTPDTVRSLTVNGIARMPGLYGSATSGAPNQLPQFTGTGKILVTMLAASRAGGFDVALPLSGAPGIECRSGGVNNVYQVVAAFVNPVTFNSASVTSGTGMVTSATGSGTTTLTVNLSGVANAQTLMITLFGVNDGTSTNDISVPMSILVGDTNGNGTVNASDVSQTKAQAGQSVTASNFRADVTANGVINASDVSLVKSKSGTSLPSLLSSTDKEPRTSAR